MSEGAIGIIGLGNIGRGAAASYLDKSSFDVVVWDVHPPARERFAGESRITIAPPGEMATMVDAILFIVPATPQIEECFDGSDGILAAKPKGLVVFDLTTSDPDASRALAARVGDAGITYFDSGTSGGPYKAEKGELLFMVGGDESAFDGSRKFIEPIAEHLFYVGPSGAGHTLKLLHNIVCHATTLATAEAGHMAELSGIPLGTMIDVFNASNARSYATEFRFPKHIVSKTWDGRSRIYNLHKDIQMGADMGAALGADISFTNATLGILRRAMARGMAEDDYTLLYRDFDAIRATEPEEV